MKKFFFDCGTRDATASLGLFVLRVSVGLMMLIGHGIPKLQSYMAKKDSFPVPDFFPLNHMTPPLSLLSCIGAEVVASALIILGLGTRPAAFAFCFSMVVAAFDVHLADPWFSGGTGAAKELALMYLIPVLSILLAGAGGYSLDAVLCKDDKRRRW
jgi:putative oxidoreductase